MHIGVPKEIKPAEHRVALTPSVVARLIARGHLVDVEHDAGNASGFLDDRYRDAGANIVESAERIFAADLIVKVKELQPVEYDLPRRDAMFLCFQQFAVEPDYLNAALASGASFIACETLEAGASRDASVAIDRLPVLAAMSRIAGEIAVQIGAGLSRVGIAKERSRVSIAHVMRDSGDLESMQVIVIGAGAAGSAAARAAAASGANVHVFAATDRRLAALRNEPHGGNIETAIFDTDRLRALLPTTSLLIGAVLIPGRTSPQLLNRSMIASMPQGAAFIDIGIDQRGISETSRMTSIDAPFYLDEGVLHCCIPNLPALAPDRASAAYANAIEPYVTRLADGDQDALIDDPLITAGLQVHRGRIVDARLRADTHRANN
jgi:alanine dehydrogenase